MKSSKPLRSGIIYEEIFEKQPILGDASDKPAPDDWCDEVCILTKFMSQYFEVRKPCPKFNGKGG
jgi:hypothetical protein